VNRVGEEGGARFIGGSSLADPHGRILARAGEQAETMILASIIPARAREKRIVRPPGDNWINRIADRRPTLYKELVRETSSERRVDA
jgi:predicted amidohydrolase